MDTFIGLIVAAIITAFFLRGYLKSLKKREIRAEESAKKGQLFSDGPQGQHPFIDPTYCIGCAACTTVCPEGDVLAMLAGKAAIVNGHKCIGHGLCAEACPTGAITMVMARPAMAADMPLLSPEYETSLSNVFIVGELGGLALIRNAVNQGRDCIDTIAARLQSRPVETGVYDVVIVGAGPAGISASLRAIEKKLNYLTIEQDQVGGTVAKYPRQKLVMTGPVEFPLHGKFKETELSKERLLEFWQKVMQRADFRVNSGEKVEDIRKDADGSFTIRTNQSAYRARAVMLALGRTGSPRKLGIRGEELPKVMYRLIEADHYVHKTILVVGGGDSAVEAAMGLAAQPGNTVTLSYRKEAFGRIKERNAQRIEQCVRKGTVQVVFNSIPVEIQPGSVVLDVAGTRQEIPNDFVWIFAGGDPPTAFLKKIGLKFGVHDMTLEARQVSRAGVLGAESALEFGHLSRLSALLVDIRTCVVHTAPGLRARRTCANEEDCRKHRPHQ
ncbi:MAG TPA: NAD(P)-binding domain-containing protein, partial [Terriglobia bacterium]|nr:NAD(P)-binding domain-containing protein [Terriglobia bacterium]